MVHGLFPCALNTVPRFGMAVAKTRTSAAKRNKRSAARFLRRAIEGNGKLNFSSRMNQMWLKEANLKPILEYLSKQ